MNLRVARPLPTYNNPLGLMIGDMVKVEAIAEFVYNGDQKEVSRRKQEPPIIAWVIGTKKKASEGRYYKGSQPVYSLDSYEPASLSVSRYVWVYECRTAMHHKSFLVMPEDIEQMETKQ